MAVAVSLVAVTDVCCPHVCMQVIWRRQVPLYMLLIPMMSR